MRNRAFDNLLHPKDFRPMCDMRRRARHARLQQVIHRRRRIPARRRIFFFGGFAGFSEDSAWEKKIQGKPIHGSRLNL
jgi:hypothetical protein